MSRWLKRVRNAVLLSLAWAVVWAPLGVIASLILDPDGAMDEPWAAIGAYPGFLCGLIFCAGVAVSARKRRLDELPLAPAGIMGIASGLIVMTPLVTGLLGTPNTAHPLWQWRWIIIAVIVLLSGASAIASVLIARTLRNRRTQAPAPTKPAVA